MAAVHLRRLARNGFDLDADLLTFLGAVHRLVVNLDAGDHTDVHKLRRARTRSHEQAHLPQVNTNGPPPSGRVSRNFQIWKLSRGIDGNRAAIDKIERRPPCGSTVCIQPQQTLISYVGI